MWFRPTGLNSASAAGLATALCWGLPFSTAPSAWGQVLEVGDGGAVKVYDRAAVFSDAGGPTVSGDQPPVLAATAAAPSLGEPAIASNAQAAPLPRAAASAPALPTGPSPPPLPPGGLTIPALPPGGLSPPPPPAGYSPPALPPALPTGGLPSSSSATDQTPSPSLGLNADERFAARLETAREPERSLVTMLPNLSTLVIQGTTIPAVLETSLKSDLPGYARAIVSQDVRGFDGSTVVIPRGSRVVGEYRSAATIGQSRALVVWTRLLRPDGGSVQLSSSGGDPLGRAGLTGWVDRHYLERFGGAALLTVVDAGATALTRSASNQIFIGSSQQANGGTGTVADSAQTAISPTINVAQGTPLIIFVARDLDFSSIGGIRPGRTGGGTSALKTGADDARRRP